MINKLPITFENIQILVAGDVMLDRYWFGEVNRISPEAPVPIVHIKRCEESLGGAANVAHNIITLGGSASLLGVVGKDIAGDIINTMLSETYIGNFLTHDAAISTIIKLRIISQQQQLLRIDFEEPVVSSTIPCNDDIALHDRLIIFNSLLPNYHLIVFSDYGKGSIVNVADMILAATLAGKRTLVDPKGDNFMNYLGATILTPNKSEMERFVGSWKNEEELTVKAKELRSTLQLEALLLTRSEEGMSLYTETGIHHFSAVPCEVFDVSGAGDTVIATLALMLASGLPILDAVELANRAGGVAVSKFGTATVSREEMLS